MPLAHYEPVYLFFERKIYTLKNQGGDVGYLMGGLLSLCKYSVVEGRHLLAHLP